MLLLTAAMLGACASGGGFSKADVDDTLQTSSIPDQGEPNPTENSDADIVRNAISAVDLKSSSGVPLNWANQDTGSKGTIFQITELREDGALCRQFKTSRESFEGVALYAGSVCVGTDKQWVVRSFLGV